MLLCPPPLCVVAPHTHTQTCVGRPYGRVGRRLLREALLSEAAAAGVSYLPGTVEGVSVSDEGRTAQLVCSGGVQLSSR